MEQHKTGGGRGQEPPLPRNNTQRGPPKKGESVKTEGRRGRGNKLSCTCVLGGCGGGTATAGLSPGVSPRGAGGRGTTCRCESNHETPQEVMEKGGRWGDAPALSCTGASPEGLRLATRSLGPF